MVKTDPPIGWVVFNRPKKLNAMNEAAWRALPKALAELEADATVRVIVIRGAGERAFSAGADIEEFSKHHDAPEQTVVNSGATGDALAALTACAKPTIAMIHGVCMGGGCAMALAIDIRLASEDATFAITPARLGLGYPLDGVIRAVQELGAPGARYLFITAKKVDAQTARTMGLVQDVFPAGELEAATTKLAHTIAGNAPKTIRALRESIRQGVLSPGDREVEETQRLIRECFDSEDYREGVRAFMEKRRPQFEDR